MGTTQSRKVPSPEAGSKPDSFFDSPVKIPSTPMTNQTKSFWERMLSSPTNSYVKVLFCGRDHFPSAFIYTSEELKGRKEVLVCQCDSSELDTQIHDAHVVIPLMTKITGSLIQNAPYLNLIMQFGVGLEGVDIDAATEQGVAVANIPSDAVGNAQSCAEHAIFLCLSLLRHVKVLPQMIEKRKLGCPTGKTILDSSILIYGFGTIGKQLAKRLVPFNPKRLVAVKRFSWQGEKPVRIDEIGVEKDFSRLSKGIDIVFICCTQNKENLGIVDKKFIQNLNPNAIIINIARGGLFNYEDIQQALDSGRLFGVGIDVYKEEPFPPNDSFLKHPKVVCTPHIAGVTEYSYRAMAKSIAKNVINLIENKDLENLVNF